jgi:hypothetical protein
MELSQNFVQKGKSHPESTEWLLNLSGFKILNV